MLSRKPQMKFELYADHFFRKRSTLTFINFKIFITKILYVDNLELYQSVKYYFKICSIHKNDNFLNSKTV
jgi:hypothetical protein